MLPGTVIVDGLWRCLCPSYCPASLGRARGLMLSDKQLSRLGAGLVSTCPQRSYSTNPPGTATDQNVPQRRRKKFKNRRQRNDTIQSREGGSSQLVADIMQKTIKPLLRKPAGVPQDIERRTTENLENMLQSLMVKTPSILSATQILRCLIRDRHVRPELRHYKALILANSDAERGSPRTVRRLLAEMEENSIPADSGTLHAALQVWKNLR